MQLNTKMYTTQRKHHTNRLTSYCAARASLLHLPCPMWAKRKDSISAKSMCAAQSIRIVTNVVTHTTYTNSCASNKCTNTLGGQKRPCRFTRDLVKCSRLLLERKPVAHMLIKASSMICFGLNGRQLPADLQRETLSWLDLSEWSVLFYCSRSAMHFVRHFLTTLRVVRVPDLCLPDARARALEGMNLAIRFSSNVHTIVVPFPESKDLFVLP